MDSLVYKLENGLTRLIERLQGELGKGEWSESFIVRESNAIYTTKNQDE